MPEPTEIDHALLALKQEIDRLSIEVMALKYFVAAIPGATETHHQVIHNVLNRIKDRPQMTAERDRIDAVHRIVDELQGLAVEFQAQAG